MGVGLHVLVRYQARSGVPHSKSRGIIGSFTKPSERRIGAKCSTFTEVNGVLTTHNFLVVRARTMDFSMAHLPYRWGHYDGAEEVYSDLKLLFHDEPSHVEAECVPGLRPCVRLFHRYH